MVFIVFSTFLRLFFSYNLAVCFSYHYFFIYYICDFHQIVCISSLLSLSLSLLLLSLISNSPNQLLWILLLSGYHALLLILLLSRYCLYLLICQVIISASERHYFFSSIILYWNNYRWLTGYWILTLIIFSLTRVEILTTYVLQLPVANLSW